MRSTQRAKSGGEKSGEVVSCCSSPRAPIVLCIFSNFHLLDRVRRLSSWKTFCGFQPGELVNPNLKVSGLHFRKTDFYRLGKGQTPKPGAIPSVKSDEPTHYADGANPIR